MRLIRQIIAITVFVFISSLTAANATDFNKQELTKKFARLGVTVSDVRPSDIEGLVELQTSGGVIFSSPNGDFFIAGKLYKMNKNGTYYDVIAKRQAPLDAKKINALSDDMIVYKAKNEKYVVTVFTDITCGYCVKLHKDMKLYNALGITIRYLAFPRQGAKGPVADQMAAIWCADDPAKALTEAKEERKLPSPTVNFPSCQKKIAQQHQLGRELGVTGTPAIYLPNGMMVGGYLPPKNLLDRLERM
ncbi:bifunctional protein-disulfide isomerase/oxidoreductase DsbC [Vibrio salinus]|uniref:bifunctional protein-disulfide isomerase/oxidoreductase DsbC n=1 Tax=Vibrio salinus TaxID=2899784 RepID=UPI001E2AF7B6|nr:bifunctional protein-disulfide isomerase/oxidoreductase DsbC [Vibrio salinus]MCE0493370.1 bifunctional protein-disulfide isomerase/oxidoreductase DsbC [Vibrio salinus]